MMPMKLTFSKSKNSTSLYIQKSFRKNGKSTSKIVRKLGTMEELLPQHNNSEDEVIAWGKKIAKKMNLRDNKGNQRKWPSIARALEHDGFVTKKLKEKGERGWRISKSA